MWISLALAAATFAAGIFVWLSQDHTGPRRSPGGGGEPDPVVSAGPSGQLPGSRTPPKPSSLDGKVVFRPIQLDGARTGCRVEFRTPDNGLARTGLKEGDVIVEVEGKPMSIQAALALTHRLEEASFTGLELTILRDGQAQQVTARIGQ